MTKERHHFPQSNLLLSYTPRSDRRTERGGTGAGDVDAKEKRIRMTVGGPHHPLSLHKFSFPVSRGWTPLSITCYLSCLSLELASNPTSFTHVVHSLVVPSSSLHSSSGGPSGQEEWKGIARVLSHPFLSRPSRRIPLRKEKGM